MTKPAKLIGDFAPRRGIGINFHGENWFSIKDLESDIDIANSKWDWLFDILITKAEQVCFEGIRSNNFDGQLSSCLRDNSNDILCSEPGMFSVISEIPNNKMIWGRKNLSKLWQYYEYPAFIFTERIDRLGELVKHLQTKQTYGELVRSQEGLFVLYRSVEQNVLWLQASPDPILGCDD